MNITLMTKWIWLPFNPIDDDKSLWLSSLKLSIDNPQVQGITVAPLNVEV
jgi:hypothetical protein